MVNEQEIIGEIFRITTDSGTCQPGWKCVGELAKELEEEGRNLWSLEVLDRVLLDRLFSWNTDQPIFEYLFETFGRIESQRPRCQEILDYSASLVQRYGGLVLQCPDMFPQTEIVRNKGALVLVDAMDQYLFQDIQMFRRFLGKVVEELRDPEAVRGIFVHILNHYRNKMHKMTLDDEKQFRVLEGFAELVSLKPIAELVVELNRFYPHYTGYQLQNDCFLGPFFSLKHGLANVFDQDLARGTHYFDKIYTQREVVGIWSTLREQYNHFHSKLKEIVLTLIKHTKKDGSIELVEYIEQIARQNQSRGKMMMSLQERLASSSLEFLFNWQCVVLKLCEPFLDKGVSKHRLVDSSYFETLDQPMDQFHFVTRIYCSGLQLDHLCLSNLLRKYIEFVSKAQQLHEQGQLNQHPEIVQRKHEMETILFDSRLMGMVGNNWWKFTFEWIYETCLYPRIDRVRLQKLPEFVIGNGLEFHLFVGRVLRKVIKIQILPQYIQKFMMAVLEIDHNQVLVSQGVNVEGEVEPVLNPYTTFKLIDLLYQAVDGDDEMADWSEWKESIPIILQYLVGFFIRVEKLDRHPDLETSNGFYDKFHMRWIILKLIAKSSGAQFDSRLMLKMVYLLLNDFTYLLDEGLNRLKLVHDQEKEAQAEYVFEQLGGRQIRTMFTLFDGYIKGLNRLARNQNLVEVFMENEIGERLASLINYHLKQLVSTRGSGSPYKVTHPAQYNFHPKEILNGLATLITRFSGQSRFQKHLLNDKRSFSFGLYNSLLARMRRYQIGIPATWDTLEHLIEQLEQSTRNSRDEYDEEVELEGLPEEFYDPLMATVMKDPVILNTSGITVDRSTITKLLLNDASDPFNRKPLTHADIVPNHELKQRMDQFMKTHIKPSQDLLED